MHAALPVDAVLPAVTIRQWVLSFPHQLRLLLAQQPEMMGNVLEIVHRTLATHLIRKAGFNRHSAQTGAVTLIQRFGSALNLNLNFHMLFLDAVYAKDQYLDSDDDDALLQLQGYSVTYWIAIGAQAARKVLSL